MTASSYRRGRHLGFGGMANVFAAERTKPDGSTMPVACKYMRADLRHHPRLVALFFQEAALGLELSRDHAGLVTILDCFQDPDENLCLVMELVDGCTLGDLLEVHGPLPHAVVRAIARPLLGALAYLHAAGVVHGDVSPCNVLLSRNGEVKLSDLGLARLLDRRPSSSGWFRGKPAYASPEQLTGRAVDGRSDLFSLGVVLYRMITGRMPFGSEGDVDAMLARIVDGPRPELPSGVPADLCEPILGLLTAAPEARTPASADAALAALGAMPETAVEVMPGDMPVASGIELAALVIEARARLDAERGASPAAPETPSSSEITQSWTGEEPRPRRRPRRARWWRRLGLAVLAVLLGALGLIAGDRVRALLGAREATAPRPAAPAASSGAPPETTGPGELTVAPDGSKGHVRPSGKSTGALRAPPRPRHTARRAAERFFVQPPTSIDRSPDRVD
jgi:serine/threonine protein kinase